MLMPLLPKDPSHSAGSTVRLQLAGALDVLTARADLEGILAEGRQAGDRVELDLGGVEFIDSSGVSMLLEVRSQFDSVGRALVVVNPSQAVLRLLQLTGLTETFGIIDTSTEPSET
jgi:anti-sigma B factor antagonist